jgi:Cell division protein CrgA
MPTKPTKRKVTGGRVTPKAAGPAKVGATPGSLASKARTPVRKTTKPPESPAERKKAADAKSDTADGADGPVRSKAPVASKRVTERSSGRYTPPAPNLHKVSPWWVPALMFTLIGAGMLVIFLNYLQVFSGGDTPSNVPLVIGLGMILGGIITATQYH